MLKNIKYLLILTTFVVLVMIFLNVYHNLTASTISEDTETIILPILPSFDLKTLEDIQKRIKIPVDLAASYNPATQSSTLTTPEIPSITGVNSQITTQSSQIKNSGL